MLDLIRPISRIYLPAQKPVRFTVRPTFAHKSLRKESGKTLVTPIELEYFNMRDASSPHAPRFIGELTRLALRGDAWAAEDAARYSLENLRRMFGLKPIESTLRRALHRTDADLKARAEAV